MTGMRLISEQLLYDTFNILSFRKEQKVVILNTEIDRLKVIHVEFRAFLNKTILHHFMYSTRKARNFITGRIHRKVMRFFYVQNY